MKVQKTKKLFALLMAIVLVVSLSSGLTAFAASNDPNFTNAPGTAYTTFLNAANNFEADIAAGPADSYYMFSGFDDEEDAANVTWTVNYGSSAQIVANSQTEIEVSEDVWASQVTVERVGTNYGPTSFRATSGFTSATMDLTVVVDCAQPESNRSIAVLVQYNESETYSGTVFDSDYYAFNYVTSVVPSQASDPLVTGEEQLAQNYHTPIGALARMITSPPPGWFYMTKIAGANILTDGSYVYGIQFYTDRFGATTAMLNGEGYSGWQYRVYDLAEGGAVNPDSASGLIGAGAFPVEAGQVVVWRYGSYMDSSLFPDNIVDVIFED
jgi:hypothetical protein